MAHDGLGRGVSITPGLLRWGAFSAKAILRSRCWPIASVRFAIRPARVIVMATAPGRRVPAPHGGGLAAAGRVGGGWIRVQVGAGVGVVRFVKPENRDQQQEAESALAEAGKTGERVAVVPFHFGKKLDSMMTFSAGLRHKLPQDAEWIEGEVTPHPAVATWIAREFNRRLPLQADDLGVVFLAHGSDFHWNETMRQAVDSLAQRYKIEFAFCMADPPLVERAVRKLEQRGARAIVVVRVFGLAASFEREVERMIGLDVEKALLAAADAGGGSNAGEHAHHQHDAVQGGHAGHAHPGPVAGPPGPPLRSSPLFSAVGGGRPSFLCGGLLDRAQAFRTAERETVILVAHGTGDDPITTIGVKFSAWLHGCTNGGAAARSRGHLAHDWPEQRAPEVTAIRRMVEQRRATADAVSFWRKATSASSWPDFEWAGRAAPLFTLAEEKSAKVSVFARRCRLLTHGTRRSRRRRGRFCAAGPFASRALDSSSAGPPTPELNRKRLKHEYDHCQRCRQQPSQPRRIHAD